MTGFERYKRKYFEAIKALRKSREQTALYFAMQFKGVARVLVYIHHTNAPDELTVYSTTELSKKLSVSRPTVLKALRALDAVEWNRKGQYIVGGAN